jgi:hypothetical protein
VGRANCGRDDRPTKYLGSRSRLEHKKEPARFHLALWESASPRDSQVSLGYFLRRRFFAFLGETLRAAAVF